MECQSTFTPGLQVLVPNSPAARDEQFPSRVSILHDALIDGEALRATHLPRPLLRQLTPERDRIANGIIVHAALIVQASLFPISLSPFSFLSALRNLDSNAMSLTYAVFPCMIL